MDRAVDHEPAPVVGHRSSCGAGEGGPTARADQQPSGRPRDPGVTAVEHDHPFLSHAQQDQQAIGVHVDSAGDGPGYREFAGYEEISVMNLWHGLSVFSRAAAGRYDSNVRAAINLSVKRLRQLVKGSRFAGHMSIPGRIYLPGRGGAMRRIPGLLVAWLVALAVIVGSTASAGASPVRQPDLAHGWGSAKACMLPPNGVVECFATQAGLRARSDQLRSGPANGSMSALAGGCPVVLFSGAGYTGNALEIWPQGYWVNLADYGFANVTVSFYSYGCGFHLADYAWGGGHWYPGYTGPWAATWDMGWSWDWRVSSVFID